MAGNERRQGTRSGKEREAASRSERRQGTRDSKDRETAGNKRRWETRSGEQQEVVSNKRRRGTRETARKKRQRGTETARSKRRRRMCHGVEAIIAFAFRFRLFMKVCRLPNAVWLILSAAQNRFSHRIWNLPLRHLMAIVRFPTASYLLAYPNRFGPSLSTTQSISNGYK